MIKTLTEQLYDLGLTEKDFKVEIIQMGEPEYNHHSPFSPIRTLSAKVNGVTCKIRTSVNIELAEDLKMAFNVNADKEIEKILKEEAISWYLNNTQFIRKQKLLKIKEKYEKF